MYKVGAINLTQVYLRDSRVCLPFRRPAAKADQTDPGCPGRRATFAWPEKLRPTPIRSAPSEKENIIENSPSNHWG